MSNSAILKSSLAKKYWMALTGLFICLFLIGHLAGNLQLFIPGEEGRLQFNAYGKFMTSNPAVIILSYLTYFSILFHVFDGIFLIIRNKKARPENYAYNRRSENSPWTTRNMGILGSVILIFIILHMSNFWYKMHWGPIGVDSAGNKDLYTVTVNFFRDPQYGLLFTLGYGIAMIAIFLHLIHGFQSAWQSLGLRVHRVKGLIKFVGVTFAILVPLLFATIPFYIYFTR